MLAACAAFLLFAPAGLFTLPLAALLMMSSPHRTRVAVITILAGGFSLAWLFQPGELPDQVLRAASVIAVAAFLPVTLYTRASVTHRACLAAAAATVSVMFLLLPVGRSWQEVHWWIEHRMSLVARLMMRGTWGRESTFDVDRFADVLEIAVRFVADYHIALLTLQVIAGLGLATALYQRLALEPKGVPAGRFRDFCFTEHLGWPAMAALVVVLVPKLSAAKLGASNVLLVLGTLYALRGLAVAAVGLQQIGSGLVTFFSVVTAFLMLPVATIGAILLGIVDTSFDLRRRWQPPPAGG